MFELERLIKYDKKDERHKQYMKIKKDLDDKKEASSKN